MEKKRRQRRFFVARKAGLCYTKRMKTMEEMKNKRICVATSGGMDSTALLHYLKAHEREGGYILSAVHCEHGIRGRASVADMRFVQKLCDAWEIPLYVFQEDCIRRAKTEKTSVETAARNFRYESFERLLRDGKADYVATAHHSQDEAETVLFRIARGASLSGAAAMYAAREGYLRPFLSWSKKRIVEYVKANKLIYREDKTNKDKKYARNKLRLEVLPALNGAVAGATGNIVRFAALAAEDDEYLYRQSEKLLQQKGEGITVLFSEEKPLFRRACLTAVKALGLDRDYTQAHLQSVFDLQKSERGAYVTLPKNIIAQKGKSGIVFSIKEGERPLLNSVEKPFSMEGFNGGTYEVKVSLTPPKEEGYVGKVLRIDGDKLPMDAIFRFRKEGDEIEKFGGKRKTLKKYYNEEKIPVKIRPCLPLLASEKGRETYVVCGYEISERVKVGEDTAQTLYITLWEK